MRTTFYNYEALEVVVLTRGRRCADNVDNENVSASSCNGTKTCTTVFVDDYRYERDIVQTNLVDWYGIISILRGSAQAYVWIRVALLIYGAYVVAGQSVGEKVRLSSRLTATVLIVLKIPFQVIVYSSMFPVFCYVFALFLDSSFMDIFLDSYWASVGGAVNFELVPFLVSTAVQMRNVWLIALVATFFVICVRNTRDHGNDGMLGIQGLVFCFTSSLSIMGPYKNFAFRNMNNVSTFRIGEGGQIMDVALSFSPSGWSLALSSPTADMISAHPRMPSQKQSWSIRSSTRFRDVAGKRTFRQDSLCSMQYRTVQSCSILQLINTAMITDPLNLFWLRVVGVRLYFYEIQSQLIGNRRPSFNIILPYHESEMEEHTGLSLDEFQVVDSANSLDVPLSILLQCG
ncbi:unnamed protein product [Phytophthora lilii]|uniref:Unnamed protein product n=1 Tax=Phytophthora lilii TaxID=2077276 RepID=A0A9W6WPK5_9STRA|nr:unnamed protein product [Phytophthora lilii]